MKFLPVLKWMINITLFAALVAGGAAIYFWKHSDGLVQNEILARFSEAAPDLKLIVGSTRLQGTHGVILNGVEIRERSSDRSLFRAQELHVAIDSNRLLEQQQVVVEAIRLKSADVLVTREEDGRWNWQNYSFKRPETSAAGLPKILVEDLRIQLTMKHGQGIPPARLLLSSPQFQAVPASQQAYDFDGGVTLPGVGLLNLSGMGDLASRTWKLGGRLRNVRADHQLMQVAQATTPQLQGHLERIDHALERLLPQTAMQNQRPVGAALLIGSDSQIAPQFLGVLDVDFDVSGSPTSLVPDFKLRVEIKDGRLASPALPIVLSEVNGVFYRDNSNLIFRLDQALGGDADIRGEFRSGIGADAVPGKAWIEIGHFPVNAKLIPLLPPRLKRLFDWFQPDGIVSASGEWHQNSDGSWRAEGLQAEIHEGTVLYHRFRYPTKGLVGTFTQRPFENRPATETDPEVTDRDVLLDVDVRGSVGERPFHLTGWWKNPGLMAEFRYQMGLTEFPLDSRFRNALEEKQQSVVDSLNLSGMANANLVFYRPPGLDQPTHLFMDARVYDAKMRFRKFPYDIENLTGHLTFNGATKHWQFLELAGQHGSGQIRAVGDFRADPSPGVLDLKITAQNAPLDADLYNAFSRTQREIWNMVNPVGFCDLTAMIDWTAAPGQSAIVHFPADTPVRVFNTKIRPAPFPFDMKVTEALLSFDPNDAHHAGVQHCEIHSFQAQHGDAPVQATGWAEAKPNGEWQVHLNDVTAKNIIPDDQLRAALPASWHHTMNRIHHHGTVAIEDSEMDFRGVVSGEKNTTARWALNLRFRDCIMNAGLDVTDLYGLVTANGTWDGFNLQNSGEIQLETAEVMEMPFTNIRGPYSLDNVELVLGARQVFESTSRLAEVSRENRIKAQAYGGELFLDALIDMRGEGSYQFFAELENARLENYAALHIPDQRNLKGIVKAWMSLEGVGDDPADMTGKGQLRISPAALYELPVIVKLLGSLSQLNLNVQNLTAFNYALVSFSVRNEAFWLKPIDLVGESISFRGQGSVGFAGAVDLDFYSRPARSRAAALPIISGLFTNWAKIEVRGTTDRPQTMVKSAAKLDEGMRQFLQPFNPNPNGPLPVLTVPRVFQRSTSPFLPRLRKQATGQPAPRSR